MSTLFDKIIEDTIVRLLSDATPEACERDIQENNPLFRNTADEEWEEYANSIVLIPGLNINYEKILAILNKHRPDLLAVICSSPGGIAWLEAQVEIAKKKLNF